MDKITKAARSRNMSRIRSKNTTPELLLRKELHRNSLRYRVHYNIEGKPDIVFVKKKIAIFVHGCFWHGHNCKEGHVPKTNKQFWVEKIVKNRQRDKRNVHLLQQQGWEVLCFWECQIEKHSHDVAEHIKDILKARS